MMSIPGFTGVESIPSTHHYRSNSQYASSEMSSSVQLAQRCPFPCFEGSVACIPTPIPFVSAEFHACWCPDPNTGRICPQGWWGVGACFGAWVNGCFDPQPPQPMTALPGRETVPLAGGPAAKIWPKMSPV